MFDAILVIAPLVLAAFTILILRKHTLLVRHIALFASIISFLMACTLAVNPPVTQTFIWFQVASYIIPISTTTAALNILLLLIVSGITPLIFTYSLGYLKAPSEQARYYFEMCIFAAAMMLFSISANFIAVFIAWEMLGITSYLLIGFWQYKPKAQLAARKAITTIIIGDVAMLIAILMIWSQYQTFEFSTLLTVPTTTTFYIAMILIAIAAFTKSAQFPFTEWLADAMEGPTPVSAFLHSSTMVKAGVFLIAVLLPIYAELNLLPIFIIFGVISALIGAMNALAEHHIKRILAYSTIEDLALMFIALGFNALYAALLFFVVQAFYKALLFMSAGSIMHAGDDEEDLFQSFNSTKNKGLFITMLIGVFSLAGFFPLSGFFGKVLIDSAVANFLTPANILIYIILSAVDLLSSIYIFRWLFVPMRRPPLDKAFSLNINYRTLPKSMLVPPVILAAFVLIGSGFYFSLPYLLQPPGYSLLPSTVIAQLQSGQITNYTSPLTGQTFTAPGVTTVSLIDAAVESIIVIVGMMVAYNLYGKKKLAGFTERHDFLHGVFNNQALTNYLYLRFAAFVTLLASIVWHFDYYCDKFLYFSGKGLLGVDGAIRRLQNGQTNLYVAIFMIGLLVMIIYFAVIA